MPATNSGANPAITPEGTPSGASPRPVNATFRAGPGPRSAAAGHQATEPSQFRAAPASLIRRME